MPDALDNCPALANVDQLDADVDGRGDVGDVCPNIPVDVAGHDDADHDGFAPCAGDCDDARVDRAPELAEWCDGVDNDCDGQIDEGILAGCGGLRQVVMLCGASERSIETFIRGPLRDAGLEIRAGCSPDDDTQALLVTRTGAPRLAVDPLSEYLRGGGQIITEYDTAHLVFNLVFGTLLRHGERRGSCRDNVQPVVQHTPGDPFWRRLPFEPVSRADSGCGFDLRHFPNITPLGGWDYGQVSLAYRDYEAGRVWAELTGWARCHQSLYTGAADLGAVLAACSGRYVLLACRPVGEPVFTVAAMGVRDEVFHNTGDQGDALNVHNGVAWYFSGNASMGFTAAGTRVRRGACDTESERSDERLCWHTRGNRLRSGWRCGATTDLNGAPGWERLIFHAP